MPDVISGVIIALMTYVMYRFALAKLRKIPEPPKKFGKIFRFFDEKYNKNLVILLFERK